MTYEIRVMSEDMNGNKHNFEYLVDEYEYCKKGNLDAIKFHKVNKGGKTRYTWIEIPNAYQMSKYTKAFTIAIYEATTGRKVEEVMA